MIGIYAVKWFRRHIYLVVILSALSSCSFTSDPLPPVEAHMFNDINCDRACWRGIRPGFTSVEEAEVFLRREYSHFSVESSDQSEILTARNGYTVSFSVSREVVQAINLSSHSGFSLTLSDIIDNLGPSNATNVAYVHDTRGVVLGIIWIYYPEAGFAFYSEALQTRLRGNSIEVCLGEEVTVSYIEVMPPSGIEQMIENQYIPIKPTSEDRLSTFISSLKPWPGFGCTRIVYPPITFQNAEFR